MLLTVDFLTKPVTREQLLSSVQAAINVDEQRHAQAVSNQQAALRLANLSSRELVVMALAVQGYPNKETARHLGISHRTVEIHKASIMHKTGAVNLLDLARIAQEAGLIP
jgi:FixJ family two-component response regulator